MAKAEKPDIAPAVEPMPATGCIICGQYEGTFVEVTKDARVHGSCAAARPDLVAKAKARA